MLEICAAWVLFWLGVIAAVHAARLAFFQRER